MVCASHIQRFTGLILTYNGGADTVMWVGEGQYCVVLLVTVLLY